MLRRSETDKNNEEKPSMYKENDRNLFYGA